MGCYIWETTGLTCAAPLLPRVEHAIILAMDGSERLERLRRPDCPLHRLCRHTIIQVNLGYRRCAKPNYVTNSAFDLTHAYGQVAARTRGWGNVLILEDDAEFMPGADDADFAHVDEFVWSQPFGVYTLGSIGAVIPLWGTRHRRFVHSIGCTQAVIWSEGARATLLARDCSAIQHIDVKFISKLPRCYTLDRPLVVQLFPTSVNQTNWCFICRPEWRALDKAMVWAQLTLMRAAGLHRNLRGWGVVTHCNLIALPILLLLVGAAATAVLRRFSR